jgi:uncharacterized membrane protein YbaN (DUF454 family)
MAVRARLKTVPLPVVHVMLAKVLTTKSNQRTSPTSQTFGNWLADVRLWGFKFDMRLGWTILNSCMKKFLWKILGFLSLGMAYVGVITPGIPYSPFVVFAAYCFAKGSPKMHAWLYNHKLFGPFLTNWGEKRVFPIKMKYFMIGMMTLSLALMWGSGVKPIGIISTAVFMALVAIWAWRYPSSVEEHDRRIAEGRKVGWFNNYI